MMLRLDMSTVFEYVLPFSFATVRGIKPSDTWFCGQRLYKMFATKLCYFENLKVCEMMIKVFNKIQDLGNV